METTTQALAWLGAHWAGIATALGLLLSVASIVTGFTKTTKDDNVVAMFRRALARISALQPSDAPGTLKVPMGKTSK